MKTKTEENFVYVAFGFCIFPCFFIFSLFLTFHYFSTFFFFFFNLFYYLSFFPPFFLFHFFSLAFFLLFFHVFFFLFFSCSIFLVFFSFFCLLLSVFSGRTHQVDGKTTTTVHFRQQPLAQPRKPRAKELAVTSPSSCLDGRHTGGSRSIPTVHPCGLRSRGCGWLNPHTLHEPKRQTLREGKVPHGSGATDPRTQPSSRSRFATI